MLDPETVKFLRDVFNLAIVYGAGIAFLVGMLVVSRAVRKFIDQEDTKTEKKETQIKV